MFPMPSALPKRACLIFRTLAKMLGRCDRQAAWKSQYDSYLLPTCYFLFRSLVWYVYLQVPWLRKHCGLSSPATSHSQFVWQRKSSNQMVCWLVELIDRSFSDFRLLPISPMIILLKRVLRWLTGNTPVWIQFIGIHEYYFMRSTLSVFTCISIFSIILDLF